MIAEKKPMQSCVRFSAAITAQCRVLRCMMQSAKSLGLEDRLIPSHTQALAKEPESLSKKDMGVSKSFVLKVCLVLYFQQKMQLSRHEI